MIEAWSAEEGALPEGWSGQALRRRVIDTQLALDGFAHAGQVLATAPPEVRRGAAALADAVATNAAVATIERHCELLGSLAESAPAPIRSAAAQMGSSVRAYLDVLATAGAPPEAEPEEFSASVALAMGNLPGSVGVAQDVQARQHRWNPLSRLDFTTRQAVQAAVAGTLAIVAGRQLNDTRYYWAVIAAFIAFSGTGSRAETFIKASNRVLGTLVGLVAGIELARLTAGHSIWSLVVIVLAMFCGFYLMRISYAYMIFFITIMVAQLYSVLHEFSDQLLVLRLEETVIGAAAGIVVALVVTPVSTRDTALTAQRDLLNAMALLLERIAGLPIEDPDVPQTPAAQLRETENQLRELVLVTAPMTRPLLAANDPRLVRHALTLYARAVQCARALTVVSGRAAASGQRPTHAYAALARTLRAVADHPPRLGQTPGEAPDGVRVALRDSAAAVFDPATSAIGDDAGSTQTRTLQRLQRILEELNVAPRQEPIAASCPVEAD